MLLAASFAASVLLVGCGNKDNTEDVTSSAPPKGAEQSKPGAAGTSAGGGTTQTTPNSQ